jgi:cytochrome c peroxidase
MKRALTRLLLLAATALAIPAAGQGSRLRLDIDPRFGGMPLVFDALTNVTAAGQRVSVTRLDFLLSRPALRRTDGTWIEQTNWFACIKARAGRTNCEMDDVPAGQYDRLRLQVGLSPEVNHKDPAQYPAGDPLNPDVNGLHWGWMGGYVFLALEGGWLRPDGKQGGWSYHLANDAQLMTVELPVTLDLSTSRELRLSLDAGKILAAPNRVVLNDATETTHSRTNDLLAAQLHENVEQAFAVEDIEPLGPAAAPPAALPVVMAANATPYRLTISQFFPRPDLPRDNPLTGEGVELGRRLFFDTRLSVNNSQSCASCHHPGAAFSDDKALSTGAEGAEGTRNAMPLLNLAWKSSFFWDGRAATLREQVLMPIQNPVEMHESLTNVAATLAGDANYPARFASAFGSAEINADRIARALEQFLLTRVSYDSKFDRVLNGEAKLTDEDTDEEQRGFMLFHTEYDPRRGQYGADCFHCHGGPLFQSQDFANNGLDSGFADEGRSRVTGREGDRGKFAVPSLRNVELTGPYMHDGRFKTLEEVVEHYCTGMKRSATLDPNLAKHPDGGVPLSESDKKALVAFLKTLTDESLKPSVPAQVTKN